MSLQSSFFRGNAALEACAVQDAAHVVPGAVGDHVNLIQRALVHIQGATIIADDLAAMRYGPATADAVLTFKRKRGIINRSYQTTPDNIVGKMTIAALDKEVLAIERKGPVFDEGEIGFFQISIDEDALAPSPPPVILVLPQIRYTLRGSVFLPTAGKWEIGLVQNVIATSSEETYSRGGQLRAGFTGPLFDQAAGSNDIWLQVLAQVGDSIVKKDAVVAILNTRPFSKHLIFLKANDSPGVGLKIQRTRCGGKIPERLRSATRTISFRAGLIARKDRQLFQILGTSPFGFTWNLQVGPAPPTESDPVPNARLVLKKILPASVSLQPPFAAPLRTTGESANVIGPRADGAAESLYAANCAG